jgi:hypothetical protein
MPAKRKATAATKAKAKAAKKTQAYENTLVAVDSQDPTSASESILVRCASSQSIGNDASVRRRLERRDTDEQIERVMAGKLAAVRPEILEGAVDEDGIKLRDFWGEQIRENRKMKHKVSTQFWTLVPEVPIV